MATLSSTHSFSFRKSPFFIQNRYSFTLPSVDLPNKVLALRFKFTSSDSSFSIRGASSSSSSSFSVRNSLEPMIPPYNVLITGSSKGIGYALAKEFLKAGDNVIICSRSSERVESALNSLKLESGKQHVVLLVMLEMQMM